MQLFLLNSVKLVIPAKCVAGCHSSFIVFHVIMFTFVCCQEGLFFFLFENMFSKILDVLLKGTDFVTASRFNRQDRDAMTLLRCTSSEKPPHESVKTFC